MGRENLETKHFLQIAFLTGLLTGLIFYGVADLIQSNEPGEQLKHQDRQLSCFPSSYNFEYIQNQEEQDSPTIEIRPNTSVNHSDFRK